jgi:5-methylcytosine-specific restriction endonuclease McrA
LDAFGATMMRDGTSIRNQTCRTCAAPMNAKKQQYKLPYQALIDEVLARGCATPGCLNPATDLDHIVPAFLSNERPLPKLTQHYWHSRPEEFKLELAKCQPLCRHCHRAKSNEERRLMGPLTKHQTLMAAYRQRNRDYITAERLRRGKCGDCGLLVAVNNMLMFEFDHIDTKTKVRGCWTSWSIAKIDAELAKCELRCYPCHKARTARQHAEGAIPNAKRARVK